MPTRQEYIAQYAEGWTKGDAKKILEACTPDYTFDDPHEASLLKRQQFVHYLAGLQATVNRERSRTGATYPEFMGLSDVLTSPDLGLVSATWWIPGTGLRGMGLIRVSDAGIVSERIAYS